MTVISKLATSKYLTDKHWEQRDGSQIKYIIPHHMATKWTGANCAQYFVNNGLENSANYCIGYAGDISCNVAEEFGPWTSSFSLADKFAITIEVSDNAKGDWTIPGPAQESLINLMVDLIQRYPSLGGKAVYDPTDEAEVVAAKRAYRTINAKGNILIHEWTSAYGTNCPQWHMKQILPSICNEVNKRLVNSKTKKEKLIDALEELGDGRYKYYDGSTNSVGCSEYLRRALVKAGVIKEGETFHALSGNVGVLGDTSRFQKIAWNANNLQKADILWSNMHHVATWDGTKGLYEAAPESSHGVCANGKTGVGHYPKHSYYNCGTGTYTWTCIYRIIENQTTRTLFEEAQYMLDHGLGGEDRKSQAKNDGFDPNTVQAQIDKMLAKNPVENMEVMAKLMPVVKKGSANVSVYVLQELLKYMGYYSGEMDGKFGDKTETALKQFQKNINLVYKNMDVDGICGSATWSRLLLGK